MRLLGIDPATHTGWSLYDNGQLLSGTWDCSIRKDESRDFRLVRLRSKLVEIVKSGPIDALFHEVSKSKMYPLAIHIAGQIEAVLLLWAHDHQIPYYAFLPSEIKKHATGKGNAPKKFVQNAAIKKFGKEGIDENEADALWILDLGLTRYGEVLKNGKTS